jgi:hypothetical protein
MNLRRNPHFVLFSRFLTARGYRFEPFHGGKHPYLLIEVGGGQLRWIIPGTASDHRGALNGLSDLKRALRKHEEAA